MDILNRDGEVIVRLGNEYRDGLSTLDFMGMELSGAVFDGSNLVNAHFEGATLCNASFVKCFLYGASFCEAHAVKADFRGADLRGADFKDANLKQACFDEADLSRDALNGATELLGADQTGASVVRAKFDGAVYDSRTKFPAGFNPKQHGMRPKTA